MLNLQSVIKLHYVSTNTTDYRNSLLQKEL